MKNELTGAGAGTGNTMVAAEHPRTTSSSSHRSKFGALLHSEPTLNSSFNNVFHHDETNGFQRQSNASSSNSPRSYYGYQLDPTPTMSLSSTEGSPYMLSPLNYQPSPYSKSPWILPSPNYLNNPYDRSTLSSQNGLVGSLVRKEGHIYSLAVSGDLLYTGSDSKNIRVWKNLKEYAGFKSNSGLVKAIVVLGERIFTGHQDGKIRVWKVSSNNQRIHKRIGSLPTFKDYVKSSVNPKNYVEVRRNKNVLMVRHFDAISCLSLDEEQGLLYSGSWDKTVKVWRVSDSKFLESINAHDDAVNSVVGGFRCFMFSGSADGTIKTWRREYDRKGRTKHVLEQVLLMQENAVTALAVNRSSTVIYGGSSDGLVNFWEREGKKNVLSHGGVLRGHKLAVLCLATVENIVFSGSADKNICVWRRDNETGAHTCLSVLTGHNGPIKCIAVEEEAEYELQEVEQYGDEDGYDEERDREDHLLRYNGHGYHSNNNVKVGDSRWIVYSGSLDKSVKIWSVSD